MKSWGKPGETAGEEAAPAKPEAVKPAEPAPSGPKPEPELPSGWQTKKASGVKAWGEGRRTDDPDKRKVLEPLGAGVGDGKSFLFLFGLTLFRFPSCFLLPLLLLRSLAQQMRDPHKSPHQNAKGKEQQYYCNHRKHGFTDL